jgi:hypothetical protein
MSAKFPPRYRLKRGAIDRLQQIGSYEEDLLGLVF